jgi:hypothetical protein
MFVDLKNVMFYIHLDQFCLLNSILYDLFLLKFSVTVLSSKTVLTTVLMYVHQQQNLT